MQSTINHQLLPYQLDTVLLKFLNMYINRFVIGRVDTCSNAAEYGHLDCLRYAHENGCRWNSNTCMFAAENGHFDCLRYAHENGCPWDGSDVSLCSQKWLFRLPALFT